MWVARDEDRRLFVYLKKPCRGNNGTWDTESLDDCDFFQINGAFFPSLKWEDEPIEVKLVEVKE